MPTATSNQPIAFNGRTFLPRPGRGHQDPVAELAPADAHGFYRSTPLRTHLYGRDGQLQALVLHNPRQGHFVVAASIQLGKPRYMYSTCTATEVWLGMRELTFSAAGDVVRAFAKSLASDRQHSCGPVPWSNLRQKEGTP
jgi:hypothetical protein